MPAQQVNEHVMNAAGEFVVQDEPIDLSVYHFEDWLAFGFFWVLAVTIFFFVAMMFLFVWSRDQLPRGGEYTPTQYVPNPSAIGSY